MAIQILPKTGLGERLGTALGTGLGAGITGLAQHKLQEMERQKNIQRNQAGLQALRLPQEFSQLPENLQPIALKQLLQGRGESVFNQALNDISNGQKVDISKLPLNTHQKSELAKQDLAERKFKYQQEHGKKMDADTEQRYIDNETKPLRDQLYKAHKSVQATNPLIKRIREIGRTGNLPNANLVAIARNVLGLDITPLLSADALELEKLVNEFTKTGALKENYGSRPLEIDVKAFFRTLPSLLQTKEGRERVLNNLEIINEMKDVEWNAYRKIIDENKGKAPENLQFILDDAVDKEIKQLEDLFVAGKSLSSRSKKNIKKQTISDSERSFAQDSMNNMMQNTNVSPNQLAQQNQRPQTPFEQIPLYGTQLEQNKPPQVGGLASLLQEGARFGGGLGVRALESLLGNYPGLASLALQIPHSIAEATTGKGIPYHEQIQNIIPSSTTLRKGTKALTGETFEPRTPREETLQEIASDIGSFLSAATNPAKLIKSIPSIGKNGANIIRTLSKAAVKSGAAQFIKTVGNKLYEGAGDLGKLVFVLGSGILGTRKGVTQEATDAYNKVAKLGYGKDVSAVKLETGAKSLLEKAESGLSTKAKEYIKPELHRLLNNITNGKISVPEALEVKRNINEKLFKESIPEGAEPWLKQLKSLISSGPIAAYSKKSPKFGKELKKADEIYRALNNSSEVTKNIKKYIAPGTIANHTIKAIFSKGLDPKHILRGIGGIAAAKGGAETSDLIDLIKQSPEIRKYISKGIGAAILKHGDIAHRWIKKAEDKANELGYK